MMRWLLAVLIAAPLHSRAQAPAPPPSNATSGFVVECTFVATICEDHFATQQHFRYGACSLDDNATAASSSFGARVIHLLNLHGDTVVPGERLRLQLRSATDRDLHAQGRARRMLQVTPQDEPHKPMWHRAGGGYVVQSTTRLSRPGVGAAATTKARRARSLMHASDGSAAPAHDGSPHQRTLLTICMQYTLATRPCSDDWKPWTRGVPQTHTAASYGRLDPPWDEPNSRFYIIQMDSPSSTLDPSQASCNTFMGGDGNIAGEPFMALYYAKQKYPDARLDYDHIEFLVPENLDDCGWAGLGRLQSAAHGAQIPAPSVHRAPLTRSRARCVRQARSAIITR